jgi:endogenous inhibitor of DNA gyrase (YacG/DUF329 family)
MTHSNDPAALTSADTHQPPASRPCPSCGDRFTPHPRKPSQTYCSERCRGAAYRRRRAGHPVTSSNLTRNEDSHEVHDVRVITDTRNEVIPRHGVHHDVDEVNAVQHCPHCRQPVVLVTLITTPAAAHVTVPTPPPTRRNTLRPL